MGAPSDVVDVGEAVASAFDRLSGGLPRLSERLAGGAAALTKLAASFRSDAPESPEGYSVVAAGEDLELVKAAVDDPDVRKTLDALWGDVLDRLAVPQTRKDDGRDYSFAVAVQGDEDGELRKLVEYIGRTASIGHSFSVVVDPDDSELRRQFGFDGDGAFRCEVHGAKKKGDLSTDDLREGGGMKEPAQGGFVRQRGDHASRKAEAETESVGIFLRLPPAAAKGFPEKRGDDQSPPHATLLFVGDLDQDDFERVIHAAASFAENVEPFVVELTDYGEFKNRKGETIPHMIPRAKGEIGLEELHRKLRKTIEDALGREVTHHPGAFKPHVTLDYVEPGGSYDGPRPEVEFEATEIEVWGDHGGAFGRIAIALGTGKIKSAVLTTKRGEDLRPVSAKILKKADEDERTVLGIVLEPETIDSQGDIYSEEEIRKTAFRFMERYQQFGFMHEHLVHSVLPLESYLAPVDFEAGGQKVRKGTWILRVRVLDDDLWEAVKKGELTGFSIGGSAIRTPERAARAAA